MRPGTEPLPSDRLQDAEKRLEAASPGYLAAVRGAAGELALREVASDDARAAINAVEELAVIDLEVPTASRIPAARLLKRAVKRLVAWYLRYFGRQISAFGQAVANLGGVLVDRTEALEAEVGRLAERIERLERNGPKPR